jgi:hypothetical protein
MSRSVGAQALPFEAKLLVSLLRGGPNSALLLPTTGVGQKAGACTFNFF